MKKKIVLFILIGILLLIPITYAVWKIATNSDTTITKDVYTLKLYNGETLYRTYSDLDYNAIVNVERLNDDGSLYFAGWEDASQNFIDDSEVLQFVVKNNINKFSNKELSLYAVYKEIPDDYVRIVTYSHNSNTVLHSYLVKQEGIFKLFNLNQDSSAKSFSYMVLDNNVLTYSTIKCFNDEDSVGNYYDLNGNYYIDFGDTNIPTIPSDKTLRFRLDSFKYTITYTKGEGNKLVGNDYNQEVRYNETFNLQDCGFTKTGYKLSYWSEYYSDSNGYTNGQSVSNLTDMMGSTVYLYAHSEPITYYVQFNKNNNSATGEMANISLKYDQTKSISSSFTLTGYHISKWYLNSECTGDSFTSISNLTSVDGAVVPIYAKWEANLYNIFLYKNTNSAGSTNGSAKINYNGTELTSLNNVTISSEFSEQYELDGFYTESSGGIKILNSDYTFADSDISGYVADGKWSYVADNGSYVYLYAHWTEK